jgi:hypothetical protein
MRILLMKETPSKKETTPARAARRAVLRTLFTQFGEFRHVSSSKVSGLAAPVLLDHRLHLVAQLGQLLPGEFADLHAVLLQQPPGPARLLARFLGAGTSRGFDGGVRDDFFLGRAQRCPRPSC